MHENAQAVPEGSRNDPRDARLDPGASFGTYRVRMKLDSVLDIRNLENLKPFLDVIAEIKPTFYLKFYAQKMKQHPPLTVSTLEQLRTILYDPNFTQWGALLDQPSASQWLGHYTKDCGINGIIYNSIRYPNGYNLAVFPGTFEGSNAEITLIDKVAGVRVTDDRLNASTYGFQMCPSEQTQKDDKDPTLN